jgi:RHS repeat-associated protein
LLHNRGSNTTTRRARRGARRASGYAISGNSINLQVRLPSGSGWAGQLEVLLSTDSGSLNQHSLGRVELSPLTRNVFSHVTFALTPTAQNVVQNAALRDLRIILVLDSYLSGVITIDGVAATPTSGVMSTPSSGGAPEPDGLPSGPSSSSSGSGAGTGTNNTATNDLRAVLGFESLGTWSAAVNGAPQFQVATNHVQGNGALALAATGYYQVLTSQVVSTPEPLAGSLQFRIFVPPQQPNTRVGTGVSGSLSCPSRGLWWGTWLGYQSLDNAPPGQWTTVSLPLAGVQNVLTTGCSDLQLTLVFNSRPGGLYIFDGAAGLAPPTGNSSSETIPYEGTPVVAEARDTWISPGAWEEEGNSKDNRVAQPGPRVRYAKRILWQTYSYDWLGNTSKSDDDEHGFYDRSLGTIENGGVTEANNVPQGPYQLTRANNLGRSEMDGSLQTAYDATGNLTDLYVDRNGDCTTNVCTHRYHYQWDEVGRMVSARRFDGEHNLGTDTSELALMSQNGALSPGAHLEFAYDSDDLRVRKTSVVEGVHTLYVFDSLELRQTEWYTSGNGVSQYVHHQLTEVPYLFANGVRLARVAYVPNQSTPEIPFSGLEPAPITGGQLSVLFTLGDHLGSTSVVLDKATSELVEKTTYQAYGTTESDYRPASWKGFRADYRFTGKEEDVEVGLVYFPKRYLNTYLQRWVSADPLEVHAPGQADANLYAYVSGAALKNVDPLGLDEDEATQQSIDPIQSDTQSSPEAMQSYAGDSSSEVASFTSEKSKQGQVTSYPDALRDSIAKARGSCRNGLCEGAGAVVGFFGEAMAFPGDVVNVVNSSVRATEAFERGEYGQAAVEGLRAFGASAFLGQTVRTLSKTIPTTAPPARTSASPSPVCSGANCGGVVCFTAGTLVQTPDGAKPIETLKLGDRVLTTDSDNTETAVDSTWRVVTLHLLNQHSPDSVVEVRLLRSPEWLQGNGVFVGAQLHVGMPELQVTGDALLVSVEPAPPVAPERGRVILGTFTHVNSGVRQLHFANSDVVIQPTGSHRFYSLDRQAWVAADELVRGERLRTQTGELILRSVSRLDGAHRVFNIEVETDHEYFVSDARVLTHNNNCGGAGVTTLTAGKNFKEHFVNHRSIVEKALGIKVGKLKDGGGDALLKALGDGIDNGTLKLAGQGTLKKGGEVMNIYRGGGLTVVTKPGGEWVTALKSGEGLDVAIQMVP